MRAPQSRLRCERALLSRDPAFSGPGIICLTGGGGKTTLMYALGAALARTGGRVLCTTTTRIVRPLPGQTDSFEECEAPERLTLPSAPCVHTAARAAGAGHNPDYLRGYAPEEVDALLRRGAADWIIVEADGAARRPLKAPAEGEPVLPALTGAVIAVAGLCALDKAFTDTWVFRPVPFSLLSGLRPGESLSPEGVARLFRHPDGLFKTAPPEAARLAFLNQADIPGGWEAGRRLGRAVLELDEGLAPSVYVGSAKDPELACLRVRLGSI